MSLSSNPKRSVTKVTGGRVRGRADGGKLLVAKTHGALWLLAGFVVFFGLGLLASIPTIKSHRMVHLIITTLFWNLTWLLMLRFGWELLALPGIKNWSWSTIIVTFLISSSIFALPICAWEVEFWAISTVLNRDLVRGWISLVVVGWLVLTWLFFHEQRQLLTSCLLGGLVIITSIGTKAIGQFVLGLQSQNYGLCFLWVTAVVVITDVSAFLTGIKLGRHQLAPKISPHKTIEGVWGGFIAGLVGGLLLSFSFIWLAPHWPANSLFAFAISRHWMHYLISGLLTLLVVVSAIGGDLLFSLAKRRYQRKDFNRLIPGHGGLLDRFDALLVATTLLFLVSFRFTNPNLF